MIRVAILMALLMTTPAIAQSIVGQASVIDGDTLEIQGTRIRLNGIDAPESDQLCQRSDGEKWRCGQRAALDLADHIAGKAVECAVVDRDRYGRSVAICSVDGKEIADWLVRNGYAFDWPRYSKGRYGKAQAEAEREGRGVWSGAYAVPWVYRSCRKDGGSITQCSAGPSNN